MEATSRKRLRKERSLKNPSQSPLFSVVGKVECDIKRVEKELVILARKKAEREKRYKRRKKRFIILGLLILVMILISVIAYFLWMKFPNQSKEFIAHLQIYLQSVLGK